MADGYGLAGRSLEVEAMSGTQPPLWSEVKVALEQLRSSHRSIDIE